MQHPFRISIGPNSTIGLSDTDIPQLGTALSKNISLQSDSSSRDLASQLLNRSYSLLDKDHFDTITIANDSTKIGDSQTLTHYCNLLLKSIAQGLEGWEKALGKFLDGLLKSNITKRYKASAAELKTRITADYKDLKAKQPPEPS